MVPHDEAAQIQPCGLLVFRVDPDVSDLGVGHADDLPGVGGIGQDLLVAGHPGMEDDLSRAFDVGPEGLAPVERPIGECEGCDRGRAQAPSPSSACTT